MTFIQDTSLYQIQNGFTPVYYASQNGHADVVNLLIKAEADINLATTKVDVSTHSFPFNNSGCGDIK